jgi:hypothetical protein
MIGLRLVARAASLAVFLSGCSGQTSGQGTDASLGSEKSALNQFAILFDGSTPFGMTTAQKGVYTKYLTALRQRQLFNG